jgi:heat shock protein HtpX
MWLLVAPVHVLVLGLLGGGSYLIFAGPGVPLRALGVIGVLAGAVTAPRPTQLSDEGWFASAADAPQLFALMAEVAAVCGTQPPTRVRITPEINAFAGRIGWRRTRVVGLGAPLWVALPPAARVGLLGHELGHLAHGDLADSWWVWAAHESLCHWADIFAGPRHVVVGDLAWFVKFGLLPFQAAVASYLWLIRKANGPASQRREYLADVDAARAAGTAGALRMLDVLLAEPAVSTAMTRAAVSPDRPDLWQTVRGDLAELDDDSFRRRRSGAQAERNRIDDSHPATVLRIQLLQTLPEETARVAVDAERSAAIDVELAVPLAAAAAAAADQIRYTR